MKNLKLVLPILIFLCGLAGAALILATRPTAEPQERHTLAPLVRVVHVEKRDLPLIVRTQGTVYPHTEIDLVPEVAGIVVHVSVNLNSGGFFASGELFLQVDPRDYELAVKSAEALVAQASVALPREDAEPDLAGAEWESLKGGRAPALVVREPQLAQARAGLAGAEAQLQRAKLDLERTRIRAPFRGRVRRESVDAGQFVTRGTPVATLYSVSLAEVRLPLPDDELAYLDLPLGYSDGGGAERGPEVSLSALFAGRRHSWKARIVRTEGELDPASRMIHAVAQVVDPYARGEDPTRPPLAVGMFVDAEIKGRIVKGGTEVPRAAMRGSDRVLVVDEDDRLRFRAVDVVRFEADRVVVASGLAGGDRPCVSPIEIAVDGMAVRVADAEQLQ